MDQKSLFLNSEGDSWFERNRNALGQDTFFERDSLIPDLMKILESPLAPKDKAQLLEVGASNGRRIEWLAKNANVEVHGVEPSAAAVEDAVARGLKVKRGSADKLDYDDNSFDILVYGYCLCMCDRRDLFRIAFEGDRVLKPGGWLVIGDFYSRAVVDRPYHHVPGFTTRKMDYREMFTWHPDYVNYTQRVMGHTEPTYTDDPNEWIACSVLRKLPNKQ